MEANSGAVQWSISETRPIRPFRFSESGLDQIEIRPHPNVEAVNESPFKWNTSPEEIWAGKLQPEWSLLINPEKIAEDVGIPSSELCLIVSMADPAMHREHLVQAWPLNEMPETYLLPLDWLDTVSGRRGLTFRFSVCPSVEVERPYGIAHRPEHEVAAREFAFVVPDDGTDFPIEFRDPSTFPSEIPADTLYFIEWRVTDNFDQSAEVILTVFVNNRAKDRLLRLQGDPVGDFVWLQLSADIIGSIAVAILSQGPEIPKDPDSLLSNLLRRLTDDPAREFERLVTDAQDSYRGCERIRSAIQASLGLTGSIESLSLAGRRR